jgi:hypothetical protein
MLDADFDELWNGEDTAELFESLPDTINFCPYAEKFYEWVNGLLTGVIEYAKPGADPARSAVSVNRAKLLLQDKWHDWRTAVPKPHRRRVGNRGHTCLFQVYEQAYHQLCVIELSLTPPLLYVPQPPQPQIGGLYLAEEA